jgi:hypothetical protein
LSVNCTTADNDFADRIVESAGSRNGTPSRPKRSIGTGNGSGRDKVPGKAVSRLDRETFDPPEASTGLLEESVSGDYHPSEGDPVS